MFTHRIFTHRTAYRTMALLVITSLLFSSSAPLIYAQEGAQNGAPIYLPLIPGGGRAAEAPPASVSDAASLFRTRVRIQTAAQWRDLEGLNPVILERGADWALVLVDEAQLETLARWRLNPDRTSALDGLVAASIQPLVQQIVIS